MTSRRDLPRSSPRAQIAAGSSARRRGWHGYAPVVATNGESDTADLVIGARCGNTASWDALVNRFASVVWSVTRSFGLPDADAAEVTQTVWLRLAEHIERIRQPERVGAWLVTTTRRECTRQLRHGDGVAASRAKLSSKSLCE